MAVISLNDPLALIERTRELIANEKEICLNVLRHLGEIERLKIHLERGFPSLFMMCVEEFKYSPAAAQRRIETMRLMREVPSLEEKLRKGDYNLTTASRLQSFFRFEQKHQRPYAREEKVQLLEELQGKSKRDLEKELAKRSPRAMAHETFLYLDEQWMEMKVPIPEGLKEKFDELRGLWSHKNPTMTYAELFEEMAEFCLKRVDPIRKEKERQRKMVQRQERISASGNEIVC